MAKIRPLQDKVLVERVESLDRTSGGIMLPDTAKEKPTEGRVIAVGNGKLNDDGKRIPMSVKAGDRVLFGSFAGTAIKEGGKEYLLLDEHELLGVLDDAPWSGAKSDRIQTPRSSERSSPEKSGKPSAKKK